MSKIGILHPGEMGVSIGASAIKSGHQVYWVSRDRSSQTRERAERHGLIETESMLEFCQTCELIFSICPPHAASEVAQSVINANFKGLYLDANAISPQRAIIIGKNLEQNLIHFVDGGIIGGPAWTPKETWLYLSGQHALEIASCFSKGPLGTNIIADEIGKASALKMCYSAYSKGTTALLAAILATAESLGVRQDLYQQWDVDDSSFTEQVNRRVARVAAKAWRFEGEMKEIATTFREAGLPGEFHEAAAEIYHRMSAFNNVVEVPSLEDVLLTLFGS